MEVQIIVKMRTVCWILCGWDCNVKERYFLKVGFFNCAILWIEWLELANYIKNRQLFLYTYSGISESSTVYQCMRLMWDGHVWAQPIPTCILGIVWMWHLISQPCFPSLYNKDGVTSLTMSATINIYCSHFDTVPGV